jgi:hypothetical protein
MVTAYNPKLKDTPFYEKVLIGDSLAPANPFKADLETVDRIKGGSDYWQSQQWY